MRVRCVYLCCCSCANRFLRCGKTEFECPVSFFAYPPHRKREFEIPFLFSVFLLRWKWNSKLYFRFSFSPNFGQQNPNCHFLFSSFVFVRYWKTEFELWFSFFVSAFLSLSILTEQEECWHFLSLTTDLETKDCVLAGIKYPCWSLCPPFSYWGK